MGLLDQKLRGLLDYIQANTPRNTRQQVSPGTVFDQGLINPNQYNAPAANRFKDSALGLGGIIPGVGDYASGVQAADFYNRGETGNAVLAGLGALPLIPAIGGIVSPKAAKELNTVLKIPDDDIFKAAVANTPGASVDESGLLMRVQRNQVPEQALQPSVRGGVFYLPEGAAQGKHYSTGKNGYGGREKIAGETLIANPLFTKGATGGKAPETAYDQLAGKGAYQAMRGDALKSYGGYGESHSGKVQKVKEFLSKYAPEMADNADYIVRNSSQGNQLSYALQEAAVGSAVRNAGHDAVLGYSKGKAGPFISEVFDVRESEYPDRFVGGAVWDSFTKPTGLLSYADEAAQNNAGLLGAVDNAQMKPPADVREFADTVKQKYGLKAFDVYENNAGNLKLQMFEVPKESRKQGIGTKAMQELTDYADASGKKLTLSPGLPDDRHGTTSRARLVKFYKKFGFVENKGRNKDFEISEGMIREPKK